MPRQKTDHLMQLIGSLTKAEKRHFRLMAQSRQAGEEHLFLQLFDVLDKSGAYEEEQILKKLPDIKKQQLPNLKANLFQQLLTSLRLLNKNFDPDIETREMLDYARVLYNKGLYRASLDMLEKCKQRALRAKQTTLALEIVEFEKLIESQYITRSIESRAEDLSNEAMLLSRRSRQTNVFSNLSLQLYGLYLRYGYVSNRREYYFIRDFFQARLPQFEFRELDFYEKVYLFQAHVWFYHTTLDFRLCYRYTQKWVNLFRNEPVMIELEAPLYLKALHNHLSALFHLNYYEKFMAEFAQLGYFREQYTDQMAQVRNVASLCHLYYYIHKINLHYMEGAFTEGTAIIPELVEIIQSDRYNWDVHREMVFYYRIACLYFGSGDFGNCIHFLNIIINQKNTELRSDIQSFARILSLIAHFELGNNALLEYQIRSVYRYLAKMENLQLVQQEIFRFLRQAFRISEQSLHREFRDLKSRLEKIKDDPYESRPFMYLDIISWLESKLNGERVEDVIRSKFLNRRARQVI